MKFRTKPIEVEAIQWTGDNKEEVLHFLGTGNPIQIEFGGCSKIIIKQICADKRIIYIDNWIVKDINRDFYPCQAYIFEANHELVKL